MRFITIVLSLLLLTGTFTGCAGTTPQISKQQLAAESLESVGLAIKAIPATMDALYGAGKVTKEDYNKVAGIYAQARTAYRIAADAATIALTSGAPEDANKAALQRSALDILYQQLAALVAGYQQGGS